MTIKSINVTETELVEEENNQTKRYPNLNTILMVEDLLKKNRHIPLKLSELKKFLPRKVMHQTLKVILEYLWKSGKIIFGPKGVQWIYSEPKHLQKMFENTIEI